MTTECVRCHRWTRYPITVSSVDPWGRRIGQAVFCDDCHEAMIKEQEPTHD